MFESTDSFHLSEYIMIIIILQQFIDQPIRVISYMSPNFIAQDL
jgi:hypothetical protein